MKKIINCLVFLLIAMAWNMECHNHDEQIKFGNNIIIILRFIN